MDLARPEHLAAIDVADAVGDVLVEQGLAHRGELIVEVVEPVDALVEIGVGSAEVGPVWAEAGMPVAVELAVGLDDRCVEAHGDPVGGLHLHPHLCARIDATAHRAGRGATTR